MFCKQCGQQISDDSVFCPKCGTRQQSLHSTQSSAMNQTTASVLSTPSGELNREALKIYLHDVLTLECIRRKYQFRMNTISRGLNMYSRDSFYKTYEFKGHAGSDYLHFLYKGERHYLAVYRPYGLDMCPVTRRDIDSPIRATLSYLDIEANSKLIKSLGMNSIWLHPNNAGYGILDKAKAAKKSLTMFQSAYADFQNCCEAGLVRNQKIRFAMLKDRKALMEEMESLEKLLKKTYDVNVIPTQFRNNLYAIYYLHDFVTSSNQSLATAMLHFDLNEIKAKLDRIIDQQEEIIIQQSVIMAQNNQLLQQNQQQLRYLSSIEGNTANAATYAQIAANNAEACAWIGLANYVSK